ncbi:MAG: hypothetical protein M1816_001929 [Peltula sp. TS41687]|nr:MAG: hypothetical protein M1816_001929 [Peltula sp. TS41687]
MASAHNNVSSQQDSLVSRKGPEEDQPATAITTADADNHDRESMSSDDVQVGVRRIEAVSSTWSKWGLISAYVGIFLMAFCTSLEGQTVYSLVPYATSAFGVHSLLAAVLVVQLIVNAVIKPPMAKIADAFGRLESFSIAVLLYVVGDTQMAASKNIQTFASAQIFYSAAAAGLQILQQIFIADTSDLLNRALWSSLPDVPFLITVWVGPPLASRILRDSTWRWGYGMWTIILPLAFLPFAVSLFINQRKAAKFNILPPAPWHGRSWAEIIKHIWFELDVMGLLLLSAALSLILLPLILAATAKSGWRNPSIIAMLVIGFVCACIYPFWEGNKRLAPKPFLSLKLLRNRTVLAGCGISFFYFMAFYLSVQPYFNSYLQIVQNDSVIAAGHVTQVFSFSSTVSSLVVSLFIRQTARYKYFVVGGSCIYAMSLGLMVRYRTEGSSIGQLVGTQIALGIGGGILNVPAQLGVQASASHQEVAAATAIFLCVLEIGGAVGSAISGAIWRGNIPKKLHEYLPSDARGQASIIFGNISAATSFAMGTPERVAINRAYQETMTILLIVALYISLPLIPLSLMMVNYKLDEMDQHVRGTVIGSSRRGLLDQGNRRNSDESSLDGSPA